MVRNYLVTALRNIARHKLYSFINIAGLAVGLACVIFIVLFIRDELSYDKWIPGTQNLYRVEHTSYPPGREPFANSMAPFPMPAAMRDEIPEVVAMTRLNYDYVTLFAGDRQFREHVAEVDPNFFDVIKLPLIKGNPASVFSDPESLVLSESTARKYFGTADAIGKTIRTTADCDSANDVTACRGRLVPLKVTGIVRDIPHNSQLDGDVFMPNTSIADHLGQRGRSWFAGAFGYVVLAPGARPDTVVAKTAPILDRALPPEPDDNRKGSRRWAIHLTPFTDVHLTSSRWRFNEKPSGSQTTLYGAGIVGTLILLVACFNFMNLSTARALLRAREIALRKAHGARRSQLVVQFLGEAVLTALLSLVVALALVAFIDRAWHAFAPTKAIDRWFMDDVYDRQYRADERQGEMFGIFVGVAIFIACLGLFGLAAFTAGRRTKEIGIRKVFGARTRDVTLLLLWQFSIPVLVANLIAWPLAWYYLHGWLQGFAYRIALSPVYFVGAGLAALGIAWITIFAHALRVARANPIHALRYE